MKAMMKRVSAMLCAVVLIVTMLPVPARAAVSGIVGSPPTRIVKYTWPIYMSGNDVKWIQSTLKAYGYSLTIDGKYGPASRDACKKFQKSVKITADGIWGPQTTAKMQAWLRTKQDPVNIRISAGRYSPGTLRRGQAYSINGLVSSNYTLTNVTVGAYYTNGSPTKQVASSNPKSKSWNIAGLDSRIKFGSLTTGTYKFRVYATANGTTKLLVDNQFKIEDGNQRVTNFVNNAKRTWKRPVKVSFLAINNGRQFGASRDNGKRKHAAIDFYVSNGRGTPVYAMQTGTVSEYSSNFYYSTQAVAIRHADGSVARYCEIEVASSLRRVGATVRQGQQIGTIKANTKDGGTMLHLEVYLGTASGALSSGNRTYDYVSGYFGRRRDLIDSTFTASLNK